MDKENRVYPKEFLEYVQSITHKRSKVVIDHILAHGFITTEELSETYGYKHPPRARMDLIDRGIEIIKDTVKSKDNKSIASYRFGNIDKIEFSKVKGRVSFSKKFKSTLFGLSKGRCSICNGKFEKRYLQIDHRIPYQIVGDLTDQEPEHFMLLCGSCNRAKSWSCEHCDIWKTEKKPPVCMQCYWGSPENYNHIAMEQVRRLDLQWNGDEIKYYDALKVIANNNKIELPEFIKQLIEDRTKFE